ncbi:MAG: pyridoxamine 5'-phosphate oxidase [Phycisphaerales bacterium]
MSIDAIRENYDYPPFTEQDAHEDPIEQFRIWFEDAWRADGRQPNAMTLATCSRAGVPSARVVLLKGYDHEGFVFFTNYQSDKAGDLEDNPVASLVFHWPLLSRTVRVTGTVTRVSREESDEYFASRPRDSQLGAWASAQSTVIESRAYLHKRFDELKKQYAGKDVPTPPHWGGYRVRPTAIEFWQGQTSRLHDRLRYVRDGEGGATDGWTLQRLAP